MGASRCPYPAESKAAEAADDRYHVGIGPAGKGHGHRIGNHPMRGVALGPSLDETNTPDGDSSDAP